MQRITVTVGNHTFIVGTLHGLHVIDQDWDHDSRRMVAVHLEGFMVDLQECEDWDEFNGTYGVRSQVVIPDAVDGSSDPKSGSTDTP